MSSLERSLKETRTKGTYEKNKTTYRKSKGHMEKVKGHIEKIKRHMVRIREHMKEKVLGQRELNNVKGKEVNHVKKKHQSKES